MRPFTDQDVPRLTQITHQASQRAPVVVLWDLPLGEFLILHAEGEAAAVILQRLDAEPLKSYVGIFDRKATEEHISGELYRHWDDCTRVPERLAA